MSFPTNPTNGLAATVNGTNYVYSSTNNSWKRVPSTVANLTVTNNITTTNVVASGNVVVNGVNLPTIAVMLAYQLAL